MKVPVYSVSGEKTSREAELPAQFSERIRPDVIARAVISSQKNKRQPYGPDREAGQRSSARYKGTRKGWGHSYGYGQARAPRLLIKKGGRRVGQVKIVPQAMGGRAVHAPLPWAVLGEQINKKERRLAIRSAIAATSINELVRQRGHRIPEKLILPIVVDSSVEELKKSKELHDLFEKLGLASDLARAEIRKARPGIGKMRGRPRRVRKSLLLVLSENVKPAAKAARNLAGVDVAGVKSLNAELLAPGASVGRLTVWSEAALAKLKEEKLFYGHN